MIFGAPKKLVSAPDFRNPGGGRTREAGGEKKQTGCCAANTHIPGRRVRVRRELVIQVYRRFDAGERAKVESIGGRGRFPSLVEPRG